MVYCNLEKNKIPGAIVNVIINRMVIEVNSSDEMVRVGEKIGQLLRGGEFIELVGDVGAGKTTLVKGIARGLKVDEYIQSPSFTISRVYDARDDIKLHHYDFYRLDDAGIMANELSESSQDDKSVTIIEWAGVISNILPIERLTIRITATSDDGRMVELSPSPILSKLEVTR